MASGRDKDCFQFRRLSEVLEEIAFEPPSKKALSQSSHECASISSPAINVLSSKWTYCPDCNVSVYVVKRTEYKGKQLFIIGLVSELNLPYILEALF